MACVCVRNARAHARAINQVLTMCGVFPVLFVHVVPRYENVAHEVRTVSRDPEQDATEVGTCCLKLGSLLLVHWNTRVTGCTVALRR